MRKSITPLYFTIMLNELSLLLLLQNVERNVGAGYRSVCNTLNGVTVPVQ